MVKGDFVGVVAEREEQAIAAMRQLKVTWKEWSGLPDMSLSGLHQTLVDHAKTDACCRKTKARCRPSSRSRLR